METIVQSGQTQPVNQATVYDGIPPTTPATPAQAQAGMSINSQKSFLSFFEGITILDIGMITLTTLALFMNIYYTRKSIIYLNLKKTLDTQKPE